VGWQKVVALGMDIGYLTKTGCLAADHEQNWVEEAGLGVGLSPVEWMYTKAVDFGASKT
jgi:hypothetical protein